MRAHKNKINSIHKTVIRKALIIKLIILTLPTTCTFIHAQVVDTFPPELTYFEITKSKVFVANLNDIVSFKALLKDMTGIDSVMLISQGPDSLINKFPMFLISGDSLNGLYESLQEYDKTYLGGLYKFGLETVDDLNNKETINVISRELNNLGFQDSLVVISTDTIPPELLNFSFSPDSINVTYNNSEITFTVEVRDTVSGIHSVSVQLSTPTLGYGFGGERISGDHYHGTYQCTFEIDTNNVEGIYVLGIVVRDSSDNFISIKTFPRELKALGFMDSIIVRNDLSDFNAPKVLDFVVSKSIIDLNSTPDTITFNAHVVDNTRKVDHLSISLRHEGASFGSGDLFTLISGDSKNGLYEYIWPFDSTYLSGTYYLSLVGYDNFGNKVDLNSTRLFQMGYKGSIKLVEIQYPLYNQDGNIYFSSPEAGLVHRSTNGHCYKSKILNIPY